MAALGSLVVQLGLNYAQFTGGVDKSEQRALQMAKNVQDTMDGLKRSLATTVGAIAGGLAAGFTISAFKGLISGSIESNAALNDLSIQTGATVEALSGLVAVGRYSDQTAESIAGAMGKLAKNMAGATEESKGTGKALDALGISFDTFKRMSPDEQMIAIAKGMDQFEDSASKAAVAQALLGKEGAKMLPFLKDLATAGELQAEVTAAQAAASDNFDDNLLRLQVTGEAWKKQLANGIIPALDLGLQAFVDVGNGAGGFRAEIKRLVDDGSITRWVTGAVTGLTYLGDVVQYVWRLIKVNGEALGAYAAAGVAYFGGIAEALGKVARGDFSGAVASIREGASMAGSVIQDLGKTVVTAFSEDTMGSKIRARMAEIQAAGVQAKEVKKSLDFTNNASKDGKAKGNDTQVADQLAAQLETIRGYDKLQIEAAKSTAAEITAARKRGTVGEIDAIEQVAQAEIASLTQSRASMQEELTLYEGKKNGLKDVASTKAKIAEQDAKINAREKQLVRELADVYDRYDDAADKRIDARRTDTRSLEDQLRQLQFEGSTIGLNAAAVRELELARTEEMAVAKERQAVTLRAINGNNAESDELERQAKLLREIAGQKGINAIAQESTTAWTKFTDSIYSGLTDSLYRGFEAGKGFGKSFLDSMKNLFKTTVLKLAVEGIASGISGLFSSGAGGSASGGGAMSLLSTASTLKTAYTWLVGKTSVGAAATAASTGGSAAAGSASAGFGAVPVVGWIAAGMMAANSLYAKGFSASNTDTRQSLSTGYGLDVLANTKFLTKLGISDKMANIITGAPLISKALSYISGESRGGGQYTTAGGSTKLVSGPDGGEVAGATVQAAIDSTVSGINDLFKTLGSTASVALYNSGLETSRKGKGFTYAGGTLSDGTKFGEQKDDPAGILHYMNNRGDKTAEEALAQFSLELQQTTIQALQAATDIPQTIKKQLKDVDANKLDTAGIKAVFEALDATINAVKTFGAAMNALPFTNLKNLSFDAAAALLELGGGLDAVMDKFGSYYENFYTEAERTAITVQNLSGQFAELGLQMPTTRDGFKAIMAAQDPMTESGRKVINALLSMNATFASVVPASESVSQAVAAMVDATKTATDAAMSALERSINAQKTAVTAVRDAAQEAQSAASAVFDLLTANLGDMYQQVSSTSGMRAADGQRVIDSALATGYMPDQGSLSDAITAARAGVDGGRYASAKDAEYAQLVLAGKLSQLKEVAGNQLSYADQQLAAANDELDRLDSLLKSSKDMVDVLRGVDTSILSLADAILGRDKALAAEKAATASGAVVVGGGSTAGTSSNAAKYADRYETGGYGNIESWVTDADRVAKLDAISGAINASGFAVTAASLQALAQLGSAKDIAAASGYLEKDIAALYAGMGLQPPADSFAASTHKLSVPGFAGGGGHEGGARVVGEFGPELEFTGPSRILSNSQSRDLLGGSNADVVAAIESLKAQEYTIGRRLVELTLNIETLARKADQIGTPPVREAVPA